MKDILHALLNFAWKGIQYFVSFFLILVLGILGGIAYALPWLLRIASVLLWFAAGFVTITEIKQFYGPLTSSFIPEMALQLAAIFTLLIWPVLGMLKGGRERVWGLMATSAITIGLLFWKVIPWLLSRWPEYAGIGLRLLPSAISMVLMVVMTLRLKWLKNISQLQLVAPAFVWTELVASKAREIRSRFTSKRDDLHT